MRRADSDGPSGPTLARTTARVCSSKAGADVANMSKKPTASSARP
jgi:hypothetical protein